ncbi:MAG: ferritin-like domain-containing protein [Moorellales bacterium]
MRIGRPTEGKCRFFPTAPYHPERAYSTALKLIEEAIEDERSDELFYSHLLEMAPSRQKPIIAAIVEDEAKHQRMFRQIYCELTGRTVPSTVPSTPNPSEDLLIGIEKALFGELEAVEKYRQILFGLESPIYWNVVFEILTDEIKHACKWNYLYTLNACRPHRKYESGQDLDSLPAS